MHAVFFTRYHRDRSTPRACVWNRTQSTWGRACLSGRGWERPLSSYIMVHDDALSLLLTGAQPDRHRQFKRQRLGEIPGAQNKDPLQREVQSPRAASSRDPLEVPYHSTTVFFTTTDHGRLCLCRLSAAQAANLIRKRYQIHVKGRNVAPPLQVLMLGLHYSKPSHCLPVRILLLPAA